MIRVCVLNKQGSLIDDKLAVNGKSIEEAKDSLIAIFGRNENNKVEDHGDKIEVTFEDGSVAFYQPFGEYVSLTDIAYSYP